MRLTHTMNPKPHSESWQQCLSHYTTNYMAARNLAPNTRSSYLADLGDVAAYMMNKQGRAPVDVAARDLQDYLAHLDRRGLTGSSRRRRLCAIKSFYGWLHDQGKIDQDPSARLVPPRTERREPRVLSKTEYESLLRACSHHPRDAAVIELLLQTGMRLSELVGLRAGDIELPKRITKDAGTVGRVHILGKGRRSRWIPLNHKACRALKTWLKVRPAGCEALFITKYGKPIGSLGVQRLVRKYMTEAGITGASVHTLRHTFATHHVAQGTSLRAVQDVLGHASLKTTSIYVQLAQDEVKRCLQENYL